MKILTETPSLINSLQSNKILKKLKQRRADGEFASVAEYDAELKKQMISIASNEGKPLFKFVPIIPGPAYSEYINAAIEDIGIDLDVAFSEISYLFSKIKSHELFFERATDDLSNLISKLEKEIEAIQLEASYSNVYNKVVHNSFLDQSTMLSLENPVAYECYYDSRKDEKIKTNELADIDPIIGALKISNYKKIDVGISNISIVTTETTVSDYDIQIPGSSPSNILSSAKTDIWTYNILSKQKLTEAASLVLEIDLGDKKEVNSITVSPNSAIPMLLTSIKYENDGIENTIPFESFLLQKESTFNFPSTIVRRFKIKLNQDSSDHLSYDPFGDNTSLQDIQNNSALTGNAETIKAQIQTQIKDPTVKGILGLSKNQINKTILLNRYMFSLGGIRVEKTDYQEKGIFVSKPVTVKTPSILAIDSKISIDTIIDPITNLQMPSSSVEYSLIKKDFNAEDELLKTTQINLLPTGTSLVCGEYLPFEVNRVVPLRFRAHLANGESTDISVFRNGEKLVFGTDWVFENRTDIMNPLDTKIQDGETYTKIRLLQTENQILNGSYYCDYRPAYVIENNIMGTADIKYLNSGVTKHSISLYGETIDYSQIYIKIILRNLGSSGRTSPMVDYYRLLAKEEIND